MHKPTGPKLWTVQGRVKSDSRTEEALIAETGGEVIVATATLYRPSPPVCVKVL